MNIWKLSKTRNIFRKRFGEHEARVRYEIKQHLNY